MLAVSIGVAVARAMNLSELHRFVDKLEVLLLGVGSLFVLSFPIILYILVVRSEFIGWLVGFSLVVTCTWATVDTLGGKGWSILYVLPWLFVFGLLLTLAIAVTLGATLIYQSTRRQRG